MQLGLTQLVGPHLAVGFVASRPASVVSSSSSALTSRDRVGFCCPSLLNTLPEEVLQRPRQPSYHRAGDKEKVMELKARKQSLFARVMDDEALMSAPLSVEDIKGLFG